MALTYNTKRRVARAAPLATTGRSYSSLHQYHSQEDDTGPFGAALANEIFKLRDWEESWGNAVESLHVESNYHNKIPMDDDSEPYQLELGLENQQELEERLRNEISKFRRGYRKMMTYALQWHHLMTECEDNPQLKKMFSDMQMIRKLTGSEAV